MQKWAKGAWLLAVTLLGLASLVSIVVLDIPAAMGVRYVNVQRSYVDSVGHTHFLFASTYVTPLQRVFHLACFAAWIVVLRRWVINRKAAKQLV